MLTRIENLTLALAAALLLACGGGSKPADTTPSDPTGTTGADEGAGADSGLVAEGAGVFGEFCASCHGDQGEGGGAPAVVGAGALADYPSDDALLTYVKQEMPQDDPGSLSDDQVRAVVAWIRAQAAQ